MTLWRNPSDQLVRVYLIPVSQLSHLDIANIKVDSQVRCHLKDISKLNTNVQKYFINSSLLNVSIVICVIVKVTIVLQIKLYGYPYTLQMSQGKLYFLTNCPSTPLSQLSELWNNDIRWWAESWCSFCSSDQC